MFRLYTEYNKAKDIFVKPKLYHKFGNWHRDPCLPVWRRGNTISIFKKIFKNKWYYDGKKGYVWYDDFTERLKKFGLGWLKPTFTLPTWLSFYIFNIDVCWKTKWTSDDIRFEFPPSLTIVIFGYSFSFWVQYPYNDKRLGDQYDYWECLLKHNYLGWNDLETLMRKTGIQRVIRNDVESVELVLKKEFIKPKYYEQYDEIASYMRLKYENDREDGVNEYDDV